jgi:2-iminobutanoate/2-iminopropanoate deaminase
MLERTLVPVDPKLFEAIGGRPTWSEAVIVGELIWVTGQVGWDKKTGRVVDGIEAQTEVALNNLAEVLDRAGSALENVILTRVYLTKREDYKNYDAVYQRFFPKNPPARVTVVVADNVDENALVDIEVVALRKQA